MHEAPGYWGLLPSAGLAALSREVEQTLYPDVRAVGAWLTRPWGVVYSVSGPTQLLHRLGFSYKLTTPVSCEADSVRQAAFLAEQLQPLLALAEVRPSSLTAFMLGISSIIWLLEQHHNQLPEAEMLWAAGNTK